MYSTFLDQLRSNLIQKKTNLTDLLESAAPSIIDARLGSADEQAVYDHLETIEDNLEKVDIGNLGLCAVCNEPVNTRLLEMDYTSQICLDHFSPEERNRLEQELALAQVVQKSLLPQDIPELPYLEISAFSRPAQVIGGDYFDFYKFADGSQGFAIADVAGHGISAALHMSSIQALLRTLVPTSSSPVEVIKHIQKLLIHNIHFSNFVTVFLASYDPNSHSLKYCNAGHNPPLLFNRNGEKDFSSKWLSPTGAAVGLVEELAVNEASIQIKPGDLLILYTDGLTEASNNSGIQYGPERLMKAVMHQEEITSSALVQRIRQDLLHFTEMELLADDTTILVCHFVN